MQSKFLMTFFGPEEMFLSMCCLLFFTDRGSAAPCFQAVAMASVLSVPSAEASVAGVVLDLLAPTYPCHLVLLWLSNMAYLRLHLIKLLWVVPSPRTSQGSSWHRDSLLSWNMVVIITVAHQ